MLTLSDGRSELFQWDTGRTLAVDAECSQVHFSNKVFGRSIDVDVVDGVVSIPDILLQSDNEIAAWAFVGTPENGYTKISKVFKVNKRNKPADYVFTPPEQTTLGEILERLDDIEESQDPDAIKNAVEDYFEQNPVEAPVQSVNGKTGTVKLTADDVGAISQDDLQEATNDALAQAKASGVFDGEPGRDGTNGKDGYTPVKGVDYFDGVDGSPGKDGADGKDYVLTDADRAEIAELAAELVEVPEGGGTGGTSDYTELTNKPKINGVELSGNKSLDDLGIGAPTDEQVEMAVEAWLGEHPEATTTVQDGSITEAKLSEDLKKSIRAGSMPNVVLMGDSVTDEKEPRPVWVGELRKYLTFTSLTNYARGAARWQFHNNTEYTNVRAEAGANNVIWNQYNRMVSDIENNVIPVPNVVMIFAGINDTFYTTIGTADETWATPVLSTNVQELTTVMKSIRYVCESIIQNYPTTQIILLTPSQTKDTSRLKLIADAIKECADILSVEVIDVNARGGFYGRFESTSSQIFTTDGTHPNASLGVPILCQYIKREMLTKVNHRGESAYGYSARITGISAEYTGSNVAVGSELASLKDSLNVKANYEDGTTKEIPYYGLSGDLSEGGTQTITVNYSGKETTFNVVVSDETVPEKTIVSITAKYTQSDIVYTDTELSELRNDLVVTVNYNDGTSTVTTAYSLSGTLTVGTSTVTVYYEGFMDTFDVTVTERTAEYVWEATTSSLYWNPVLSEDITSANVESGGASVTTEIWGAKQILDKAFKATEIQFRAVGTGTAKFVVCDGTTQGSKIINTLEIPTTGKGLVVKEVDFIIPAGGVLYIAPTNVVSVVNLGTAGNVKPSEATHDKLLNMKVDSQALGGSITKVSSELNYYANYSLTGYREV